MEELVGQCCQCGKRIYCDNGFFNGVYEQGKLFCVSCKTAEKKSLNK